LQNGVLHGLVAVRRLCGEEHTADAAVLIAGATGNIGFAAATALASRGRRVVLLGRDVGLLRSRLAAQGSALRDEIVEPLAIDFADTGSVRRAAAQALQRFSRIDGIVHSSGVFLQGGPSILPDGHELMFASNVLGPFLLTELLFERLAASGALVAHVIALFNAKLDWSDLESIDNHRPMAAFNRTKVYNRVIAAESARRHGGRVSHVAFDPTFVIDKSDPELAGRWPKGATGLAWRALALFAARPPAIAGEPLADLFTEHPDRAALNGRLYRLAEPMKQRDPAMCDTESGTKLWQRLTAMTTSRPAHNAGD
jgi:NAD(P)-dependent dehydrogenase (short-subunit alcohol dehydrogenase family)